MNKISVIVPVFNAEKYLDRCINSILSQSYKNIEIILVDDGSTDNSGLICDKYSICNKNILTFHTKNSGAAAARNLGLKKATGDFFAFVDSDDFIENDMYELLFDRINKDKSDLAICSTKIVDEQGAFLEWHKCHNDEVISRDEGIIRVFNLQMDTGLCDKLFKKECFKNIILPEGQASEDRYVIHEIFMNCDKISLLSNKLYNYVQRSDSITHSMKKINKYGLVSTKHQIDFCVGSNEKFLKYAATSYCMINIYIYNKYINNKVKCSPEELNEYQENVKRYLDIALKNDRLSLSNYISMKLFVKNIFLYEIFFKTKKFIKWVRGMLNYV